MSYQAEVLADSSGRWAGNAIRFATELEALHYGEDLAWRWTSVRAMRVTVSPDPVNYIWRDGRLERLGQITDVRVIESIDPATHRWDGTLTRLKPED